MSNKNNIINTILYLIYFCIMLVFIIPPHYLPSTTSKHEHWFAWNKCYIMSNRYTYMYIWTMHNSAFAMKEKAHKILWPLWSIEARLHCLTAVSHIIYMECIILLLLIVDVYYPKSLNWFFGIWALKTGKMFGYLLGNNDLRFLTSNTSHYIAYFIIKSKRWSKIC